MKVHHITEAPRIEPSLGDTGTKTAPSGSGKPVTGITGTKAAFANKNGGVSKGTIVGPAANGNPNQVSFKDSKGKTFNVSINKLLDPKKLTPLNIGLDTSTTTAAPKADAPDANKPSTNNTTGDLRAERPDSKKQKQGILKKIAGSKTFQRSLLGLKLLRGSVLGTAIVGYMNVTEINKLVKNYYAIVVEKGYDHIDARKTRFAIANAMTDMIIESSTAFVFGALGTWAGVFAMAGLTAAGGPLAWIVVPIVGIAAGIGAAIGGTAAVTAGIEAAGLKAPLNAFVVESLTEDLLGKNAIYEWGEKNLSNTEFAVMQVMLQGGNVVGTVGGAVTNAITGGGANTKDFSEFESYNRLSEAASNSIKSSIKSSPEAMAGFKAAKEIFRLAKQKEAQGKGEEKPSTSELKHIANGPR
jgi:hypothetical protein